MTAQLDYLPDTIVTLICTYLDGIDVIHLSETCRSLRKTIDTEWVWGKMIERRFGVKSVEKIPDDANNAAQAAATCLVRAKWQYLYLETRSLHLSAEEMKIVWNNTQYWSLISDDDAKSRLIAKLHSVCWLDVRGCLGGVRPGLYRCVLRMKLKRPRVSDITKLTVSTSHLPSETVDFTLTKNEFKALAEQHSDWFDLEAGQLAVSRTGPVSFSLTNHTDTWKSGIFLDYFELQPTRARDCEPVTHNDSTVANNSRPSLLNPVASAWHWLTGQDH